AWNAGNSPTHGPHHGAHRVSSVILPLAIAASETSLESTSLASSSGICIPSGDSVPAGFGAAVLTSEALESAATGRYRKVSGGIAGFPSISEIIHRLVISVMP